MSSEFAVWHYESVPHAAVFTDLRNFEYINLFDSGKPLAATFPADVALHMDPDFPNDLLLPDSVGNSLQLNVASQRLADVLRAEALPELEYLPLTIVDHKGRVASATHVIVHPVGLVDCIDLEQSVYKPNSIVPGKLSRVKKLVLDAARVPPGRMVFKCKGYGEPTIIRKALAAKLMAHGFTGLAALDITRYPAA
jgi:hypothetical protein